MNPNDKLKLLILAMAVTANKRQPRYFVSEHKKDIIERAGDAIYEDIPNAIEKGFDKLFGLD